jgi:hypothetical protein
MARKNAFVTLKDHKENFDTNPKCRLLNPSKSELGKVSKVVLDRINDGYRTNRSAINAIIIRVITKSTDRVAGG